MTMTQRYEYFAPIWRVMRDDNVSVEDVAAQVGGWEVGCVGGGGTTEVTSQAGLGLLLQCFFPNCWENFPQLLGKWVVVSKEQWELFLLGGHRCSAPCKSRSCCRARQRCLVSANQNLCLGVCAPLLTQVAYVALAVKQGSQVGANLLALLCTRFASRHDVCSLQTPLQTHMN